MVDNTIALQVRPFQMPDIGQIYGNVQNIQLNRMRMAEAQEMGQERNALRALAASGVDPYSPEGLAQLRRVAPTLAPQYAQAASQQAYQRAQVGRLTAQTQTDQIKTARDLLSGVTNQAQWDAWRQSTVAALPQYDSVIPREFSPQNVQRMAEGAEGLIRRASEATAAGRPNEFERALAAAGIRPGTPEYQAAMRGRADYLSGARPETPQVATGPDGRPMLVYPRSGGFTFAQEMPSGVAPTPTPTPAAAPVDLRRPQAAATPAQPTNMMLPNVAAPTLAAGPTAVPPAAPAAPTTFEAAQAAREAREVRTAGARVGAEETARIGARSDAARRQEQEQLNRAITELRAISAPGGLLEKSTGSGLGTIRDNFLAFFGASTSGAQAGAALAPIADIVTKLVPRFEGPQSNADVQSYREAAGRLADTTLPNATRAAAAREILRLFDARRDQFEFNPGGAAAPTGTPPPARTGQPQTPTAFREGQTATGPNGQRIQFLNGQWVPAR